MCNEVARRISLDLLRNDFDQRKIRLFYPENAPNMEPLPSIRITDSTVIVRAIVCARGAFGATEFGGRDLETLEDDGFMGAELVTRRWSWPGAPVYNFRSDGRDLASGRCLIPVDAFYEFTTAADPKAKRKDKWTHPRARRLGGLARPRYPERDTDPPPSHGTLTAAQVRQPMCRTD
ncbi:MAG: hypothetical protein JWL66_3081 [Sphingomonadales bacterium]|nr:hypothetical protein [Sphingomonadales bacterium]